DRKLRLFACACCRRVLSHLREYDSRSIVYASEKYADADDPVMREQLQRAEVAAWSAYVRPSPEADREWLGAGAVKGLGEPLDVQRVLMYAGATPLAVREPDVYPPPFIFITEEN